MEQPVSATPRKADPHGANTPSPETPKRPTDKGTRQCRMLSTDSVPSYENFDQSLPRSDRDHSRCPVALTSSAIIRYMPQPTFDQEGERCGACMGVNGNQFLRYAIRYSRMDSFSAGHVAFTSNVLKTAQMCPVGQLPPLRQPPPTMPAKVPWARPPEQRVTRR